MCYHQSTRPQHLCNLFLTALLVHLKIVYRRSSYRHTSLAPATAHSLLSDCAHQQCPTPRCARCDHPARTAPCRPAAQGPIPSKMPKAWCDYCASHLVHDSEKGRRQHNYGHFHRCVQAVASCSPPSSSRCARPRAHPHPPPHPAVKTCASTGTTSCAPTHPPSPPGSCRCPQ